MEISGRVRRKRYRYRYYGITEQLIKQYKLLGGIGETVKAAADAEIEKIEAEKNGEVKAIAIRLLFFEGKSLIQTADIIHYDSRTVQIFKSNFVYGVAKRLNFSQK